jgi:hypothetical protein
VAQYKNVLVAIYNAPRSMTLGETWRHGYSHAWVPAHAFDRVERDGAWTFAKKGDGYVALYSHAPPRLKKTGQYAHNELVARGRSNVWVCEMGSARESGSFDEFMEEVSGAGVEVKDTRVGFHSPSRGLVEFGWTGPFKVGGEEIPLRRDMRYDNPYVQAPRFTDRLEINCRGESLILDFANQRRIVK